MYHARGALGAGLADHVAGRAPAGDRVDAHPASRRGSRLAARGRAHRQHRDPHAGPPSEPLNGAPRSETTSSAPAPARCARRAWLREGADPALGERDLAAAQPGVVDARAAEPDAAHAPGHAAGARERQRQDVGGGAGPTPAAACARRNSGTLNACSRDAVARRAQPARDVARGRGVARRAGGARAFLRPRRRAARCRCSQMPGGLDRRLRRRRRRASASPARSPLPAACPGRRRRSSRPPSASSTAATATGSYDQRRSPDFIALP